MQMMPIEIRQKPVNKSLCAHSSRYNQGFFITRAFAMHLRKVKCCVTKHVQHNAYNFIYKTVYTCITYKSCNLINGLQKLLHDDIIFGVRCSIISIFENSAVTVMLLYNYNYNSLFY